MHMKWLEPEPVTPSIEISAAFQEKLLIAEQLSKKGIVTIEQARQFLTPKRSDQSSPFDFPDIEKAVERVKHAIKKNEQIGIWGDFDVDGQTSTAVLVDGLRKLGANVKFHIPVRADESHGIQLASLQRFLRESKSNLIITCDTGITEVESIQYLTASGIDTIITDHHIPGGILPLAFATINPHLLPHSHPFHSLVGVGTAFQLIRALFLSENMDGAEDSCLDLVSLGTIADLADLTGDNRYYAKAGLSILSKYPRQAFKAIANSAEFHSPVINESHIGFLFAPRLNAVGRLSDANPVVNFLLSNDEKDALIFARKLEEYNNQRRITSEMVFKSAVELLEKNQELSQYPVIVLEHEKWEKGVVGIAASRLVEKFNKPAILLCSQNGIASGSARSIEGVNIINAIQENSQFLIKFGGHPMAAGLSINVENIFEFRENLSNTVSRAISGLTMERNLEIDAYLPLNNINEALLLETEQLAPFGPGNPPVVLAARNLEIEKASFIGRSQEHRKLILKDMNGFSRNTIWWGSSDQSLPDGLFDLAFYLRRDDFRSNGEVLLEWLDHREARSDLLEIHNEKSKLKVHDYRFALNQYEILEKMVKEPEIVYWAEGIKIDRIRHSNRLEINKSIKLALLVSPPNMDTLREIFEITDPLEIYLFNIASIDDSFNTYMKKMIGHLNYCIKQKNGEANIIELEVAIGQTDKVIGKSLEFLREKGDIEFLLNGKEMVVTRVNRPRSLNLEKVKQDLIDLLEEVAAFRSYFLRVDPPYLLSDLKK